MEHEIKMLPGYDWRGRTPNYGQHPPEFLFIARGEKGAVVLQLTTGWYSGATTASRILGSPYGVLATHTHPTLENVVDVESHAIRDNCDIIGGPCIGQTTFAIDNLWLEGFFVSGLDWLWGQLDQYYLHIYEGGPYPGLTPTPLPFLGKSAF